MKSTLHSFRWFLPLLTLAFAAPLFAQTTGRIEGRVHDNAGVALPGVTLTLDSSALQGQRLVVTDEEGRFRFLALAPGAYTVKSQLEGFNPLEQTGIQVGLDRTVSLELTFTPAFGEVDTVLGSTVPVIDTTSTTTGANFSQKLIADLPVTRTFQGLAFAAPGVTSGASRASGLDDNPSIGGASAAENRYVVDGLDTTDAAFGIIATEVPFEFIQEVEVKTGGYEAEYSGALGGVLNVITKSGGNDLQGDAFGYYSDDSLQSAAPATQEFGRDLGNTEYDFGAAVGGKLVQDKLWFFLALNPSQNETDYTTRTDLANTETEETLFYAGKLTLQATASHQFVLSAFGDPTDRESDLVRNSYGLVGDDKEFGADNLGLTYNGSLSSSLFLELGAGRTDQTFRQTPFSQAPWYELRDFEMLPFALAQTCPGDASVVSDPATFTRFNFNAGCVGATFETEDGDSSRDDLRSALTWFAQTGAIDHELKVGANLRRVDYASHAHYPGGVAGPFFDATGGSLDGPGIPVDADGLAGQRWQLFDDHATLIEYDQNSVGETDEQAVFVQDRVRIGDHFTLNVGVRSDAFQSKGELSDTVAGRELDFGYGDTIAPRLGFTWDVAGNGRSKLYGHYGRFYESVPLDINARAFGNERFNFFYFYYPEDGSLPSAANPGVHFYTYRLGGGTLVDPGIEPMYTEEYLFGIEYEIANNLAIGLKATDRSLGNVIEDISVDGGQTYFITNPGGVTSVNPVTGEPLDAPVTFPEAVRDYVSYEVSLSKRFSDDWQLFGSYVHSENEGNYGGLFRQDNAQLDPNITSLYDLPELLEGATGLLPNDREHQFKLYGSYLWPFKLVTGFYGQFLSGTPISKLGGHPTYGDSERFVTPRGSAGRTSDIWNADLHLEYPIGLGYGLGLKLIADVFNVSDEQEATLVDQDWTFARLGRTADPNECGGPGTGPGTACPQGNPLFGQPTEYQVPRTLRLGVKLSW